MNEGPFGTRITIDGLNMLRRLDGTEQSVQSRGAKVIGLIEERSFIRECIRVGLQLASHFQIVSYSSIEQFKQAQQNVRSDIVLIACFGMDGEYCATALDELRETESDVAVIVLGPQRPDFLNIAVAHGARGYIPYSTNFAVVIEAMRIVLVGGTYVPMDCLTKQVSSDRGNGSSNALTAKELSVVRAIQQGKSNKAIAYCLNLTESTVKVHVRNVMVKLRAKNRTEIAIMLERNPLGTVNQPFVN